MKALVTSLLLALVAAAPAAAQPGTSPRTPAATKPAPATSTAPAATASNARASAGAKRAEGVQAALKDKGYDPGPVDGRMGPKSRSALRAYQKKEGLAVTGHADAKTLVSLKVAGPGDAKAADAPKKK